MSLSSLPRMFFSSTEGWQEVSRVRHSVARLCLTLVLPLSVIPPAMFAFSAVAYPGSVFPVMEPPLEAREVLLVATTFFFAEVAMVFLMASIVQHIGEVGDVRPSYEDAFTFAAIAPVPLWLAPLALFVPNVWVDALILVVAWVGCVALIRHGIRPLFKTEDEDKARLMAEFIVGAGVMAWMTLMVVLVMVMSILMGWR